MTRFSVIIPAYNRGHLVSRAIGSALGQTFPASQVIVVDDGSTDNTAEACKEFGTAIEYFRQPNLGVSAARNQGIRFARHPWTAFLDSDDYWDRTHLEKLADAIEATSGQARFYFADMRLPGGASNSTLWAMIGFKVPGPHLLTQDGTDWVLAEHEPTPIQSSVFNTGILKTSGGFDPRFRVSEDRELFCRLGVGGKLCAVNSVGCVQTADENPKNRLGKIVHTRSPSFWEHERMLWESVRSRYPNLGPSYQQALRCNLAIAHWRLTRLYLRSGQYARGAASFLQSAFARPNFILRLIRYGKSDA